MEVDLMHKEGNAQLAKFSRNYDDVSFAVNPCAEGYSEISGE
jgi:hypothetical protein